MLTLTGRGTAHTCDGITRRDFMQVGALGAIGLTLPQYLAAKEAGAVDKKKDDRACIMIFNLGAPSHVDTFDMKPDAPAEIRGPFKPISTKSSEIQISEIFPRHAQIAEDLLGEVGPVPVATGFQAEEEHSCFGLAYRPRVRCSQPHERDSKLSLVRNQPSRAWPRILLHGVLAPGSARRFTRGGESRIS